MSILGPTKQTTQATLTIRRARADDAGAILQLAQLDEEPVPAGDLIVAAVGDELWAAMSMRDFRAVADPFRPSGDLVLLLAERVRALRRAERPARSSAGRWAQAWSSARRGQGRTAASPR